MYAELSAYENCHYLAFMNIFSLYITVPGTITSVKGSHDSQSQSTFVHQAQYVPAKCQPSMYSTGTNPRTVPTYHFHSTGCHPPSGTGYRRLAAYTGSR